ncbi:hypothetical protein [Ruania rhizosphaerae]|uniref:hypothetical protein n=1 Tax=Ruania rhizosphaerae TaxID=1840413 RepID=UPI00135BF2D2|nr:hypothetical protein [Ruania rhizosphaerae]
MTSERSTSGSRDRPGPPRRRDRLGIIRARWLVTTLAIVSAAAGVSATAFAIADPAGFRAFITQVTDLRIAAFVFGAVALGGSMDQPTSGPGLRPPTGWRRGTFVLSVVGLVPGLVLLIIGLIGWLSG